MAVQDRPPLPRALFVSGRQPDDERPLLTERFRKYIVSYLPARFRQRPVFRPLPPLNGAGARRLVPRRREHAVGNFVSDGVGLHAIPAALRELEFEGNPGFQADPHAPGAPHVQAGRGISRPPPLPAETPGDEQRRIPGNRRPRRKRDLKLDLDRPHITHDTRSRPSPQHPRSRYIGGRFCVPLCMPLPSDTCHVISLLR
ncbi:MAG: hypothetical protein BWY66_02474 [bacterium ADurb.Bin374]|nr:MAG: hypothetical protein BWY66_02474 [bacterium ADurb.Bin374]